MYTKIKELKTYGSVTIMNQELFLIEVVDQGKRVIKMELNGIESILFEFIDVENIYSLAFAEDYFMVSFKSGTTTFYSINSNQKVFQYNTILPITFLHEDGYYMYMDDKDFLYRYNKCHHEIKIFPIGHKNMLLACVFNDNLICEFKGGKLFTYKNNPLNVLLSWQLDIRSLFPAEEDAEISEIKDYQGSLIVVTSAAVLRLSVEDGSIIWISEGYARTIEIVGNTGYVCTSGSLFKVNLDTGEESGYGWGEYHKLPNFTYNGKDYWATGHRVVYHDGLLWYSVYSSGDSFLIAINPENGNYEWIHYVDTIGKTDAPQFFGDYMFLYDTEHTLHIYQKES